MLVGSWHNLERFWERKFLQVHEQSILPPLWEIIFENISCYRPFQKTWKETLCVPLNQIKVSFSWEKKWGKFFFLPFKKKKKLCANLTCHASGIHVDVFWKAASQPLLEKERNLGNSRACFALRGRHLRGCGSDTIHWTGDKGVCQNSCDKMFLNGVGFFVVNQKITRSSS